MFISEYDPNIMLINFNDNRINMISKDWRVPVVRSIAPQVSETIDREGWIQRPHIADNYAAYAYVPGFIPYIDRYYSRQDKAQWHHNQSVISAIKNILVFSKCYTYAKFNTCNRIPFLYDRVNQAYKSK